MPEDQTIQPPQITKATGVSLGVLLTFAAGLVSFTLWISAKLTTLEHSTSVIKEEVRRVQGELERRHAQSWDRREMDSWARMFKAQNPDLEVPEVR